MCRHRVLLNCYTVQLCVDRAHVRCVSVICVGKTKDLLIRGYVYVHTHSDKVARKHGMYDKRGLFVWQTRPWHRGANDARQFSPAKNALESIWEVVPGSRSSWCRRPILVSILSTTSTIANVRVAGSTPCAAKASAAKTPVVSSQVSELLRNVRLLHFTTRHKHARKSFTDTGVGEPPRKNLHGCACRVERGDPLAVEI